MTLHGALLLVGVTIASVCTLYLLLALHDEWRQHRDHHRPLKPCESIRQREEVTPHQRSPSPAPSTEMRTLKDKLIDSGYREEWPGFFTQP